MSRRPQLLVLAAVVAGGLALGACGIPTQPSATPVSKSQSQLHLPPAKPPVSPCTKSGCVSVDVYFVTRSAHLSPVGRVVPRDAKLATVIRSLLGGPTTQEIAGGITTVLGSGIQLLGATTTSATKAATLDFNGDFGTLSGTQEVLGVAQVVYTVSGFMPGAAVTFEIEGVPIEVPVETGLLVATGVHESQYASLRTSTASTTTTTP
ncbi:MAG TPA: GerMN domain-containing protein [Acidimicrobiales bacterium]|nr:GerMN domain-containing protein [Acidimicrobiales bacterium]